MKAPNVLFLHGPVASGKLTIAQELSALTGFALFHNHLTVDLLLTLFPFGSPEFCRNRERIWVDLMTDAVAAGRSLIFTFAPERTVSSSFPMDLKARVETAGGRVRFIGITCAEDQIEQRVEASSRHAFKKLRSLDFYRQLRLEGAFAFPAIASEIGVDSGKLSPAEAAREITRVLDLS